ncbi:MAG: VOC family protein [Flavobacteriaceae bacterium]|nr:VOC family protein [Flavobacteriaceae bacterium]
MNLNQVTLPSTNLEASVAFYTTLGFNLIVDALPRYARFECIDGEATFSIHYVETIQQGNSIVIYFEDKNIDYTVKKLQEKGIEFTTLPQDQSWLWREATLVDPDGNNIILYYAGKNRKNPPWRIN